MDTTTNVLAALEMPTPCGRYGHHEAMLGCVPTDAASWSVLIRHSKVGPGGHGDVVIPVCDGSVQFMTKNSPYMTGECPKCGAHTHNILDWFVVIGPAH